MILASKRLKNQSHTLLLSFCESKQFSLCTCLRYPNKARLGENNQLFSLCLHIPSTPNSYVACSRTKREVYLPALSRYTLVNDHLISGFLLPTILRLCGKGGNNLFTMRKFLSAGYDASFRPRSRLYLLM